MNEIEQAKLEFLNRYNPMITKERALSIGINVPTKWNPIYMQALNMMPAVKDTIHQFWSGFSEFGSKVC